MRWLRPLLVIFLCPLLLLGASPEDFTAKLSASPNPLTLDDQAIVQLDLTFPSSYTVAIDTLQQRLSAQMLIETPAFQLVDQKSQQEEKEGVTSQQFTWVLDPQIIGQTQLGLVSIPFVSSTGEMIKIPVAPLTIQVSKSRWLDKGETIETAPLMPLSLNLPIPLLIQEKPKTVEEITAENRALLAQHRIPWLELLYGTLVTLALVFVVRTTGRPQATQPRVEAQVTANSQQRAIRRLKQLKPHLPHTAQEAHRFFSELSDILRTFLEETTPLHAKQATTPEFLQQAALDPRFSSEERHYLKRLLSAADSAKFGYTFPQTDESHYLLQETEAFIRK